MQDSGRAGAARSARARRLPQRQCGRSLGGKDGECAARRAWSGNSGNSGSKIDGLCGKSGKRTTSERRTNEGAEKNPVANRFLRKGKRAVGAAAQSMPGDWASRPTDCRGSATPQYASDFRSCARKTREFPGLPTLLAVRSNHHRARRSEATINNRPERPGIDNRACYDQRIFGISGDFSDIRANFRTAGKVTLVPF